MPLHEDNSTLNAFRGIDYKPSLSRKRGTGGAPMHMGGIGEKFLAKLGAKNDDSKQVVFDSWDNCIPSKFTGKCFPQNLRLGVLYVSAANPAIKQELLFAERAILKKVQALKGCQKIKKIRFL